MTGPPGKCKKPILICHRWDSRIAFVSFQTVKRGELNWKNKLLWFSCCCLLLQFAITQSLDFDQDSTGLSPKGFSTALTGEGKSGRWIVMKDETAPSKPNVLAQIDMDPTDYRFPLCILDSVVAKDVDVSVKFKAVKGKVDQAGGLVWRYQTKDNYYIVRANALENNFRMYRVVRGRRQQFAGANVKVIPNEWHIIRVRSVGTRFEAYFDDKKLIDATDNTFTSAGKVGMWTKADSYTLFDDLSIQALK